MPELHFSRDADGHTVAKAAEGGSWGDQALAQFLTEEVRAPHYVDLLLERAEAALRNEPAEGASGNAYFVAFATDGVTIEHHYLKDWRHAHIPLGAFIDALREWRAQLLK